MAEISRRSFLQVLGLGASALVAGCQRDEAPAAATTTPAAAPPELLPKPLPLPPPGDLPFSVWEEVRAALRAAPDHLPAQADAVVAQGDPEAIFAFVRDRISVLPPGADGFQRAVTGRRWGLRGTLRCGWGTPRERADLLADLYRRAGFEAEVVEGALNRVVRVEELLRPRGDLTFAPPVDAETVGRWHRELKITASAAAAEPDPDGTEAAALADGLLSVLAASGPVAAAVPFSMAPPDRVPLVRVMIEGAERFANTLVPDAPFGESLVDSPVKALGGDLLGEVRVSLACARTTDPAARIVLAAGRWPLEEAIGGTVIARFVPTGDFAALFTTPRDAIHSFTALLGLDAPQLAATEVADAAVLGDSISVYGDHFSSAGPAGGVAVGDEAVGGNPDAVAAVAALTASVSAQAFPSLFLTVGALDAAGTPLSDLPAAAFALDEDGLPLSFVLTASHAPPPSVLLLFDGSRSLPAEFVDAGMAVLARRLAEGILEAHPGARFRLAGVNYGTASVSPAWLTSGPEVAAEAARVIADGSELWSALADARQVAASVIVLVTDGRASDSEEQIAAARHWVHSGPPVVVVGVGDYDAVAGEDLAGTSGGVALLASDHAGAVAAVLDFLRADAARPHRLASRAPVDGAPTRRLRVRVRDVETSVEYTVPAPAGRLQPPALSGLYLTIGSGSREVTRTLAGIPWEEAAPTTPVPPAVIDEVRAALVGGAVVSLEAGPPTASVWLDDFLTAKLSLRPLYEARSSGIGRQVEALGAGIRSVPPRELPALQGPAPVGEPRVFPSGTHAVLLTARPLPSGAGLRRADLLPFATWSAAAADSEAFAATLRRTAQLALREASLFPDSTLARLKGRVLMVLPPATPAPRDGVNAPWARLLDGYSAFHRLVPADDGPFAFWAVDAQGSLLGILPDGSGGGSATDDIASQCEGVSRMAAATQLSGAGLGLPFAGLVSLQKAISLQALRAAAVVATLEDPKIPKACDKGLGDLACDWAKDTLASAAWTGYGAIDTADDVVEAAGGGGLVNC